MRRGRRLRVRYRRSGARHHRPIVVDPYGVLLRAGRWYLLADTDGEPRMYALSRLADWEVLDEPRRLRANTTLTELAGTLGASLEGAQDLVVTVRLDADHLDIAKRILGKRLLSTGSADAGANGDADASASADADADAEGSSATISRSWARPRRGNSSNASPRRSHTAIAPRALDGHTTGPAVAGLSGPVSV
ncbi:WYL domain-containing protein [Streptomyces sp. NPDC047987]|uniref:WYL domain-containing protein n=1 Tax=unclassified Streptomyces TaxID=2593676 RepID=UPI00343DD740